MWKLHSKQKMSVDLIHEGLSKKLNEVGIEDNDDIGLAKFVAVLVANGKDQNGIAAELQGKFPPGEKGGGAIHMIKSYYCVCHRTWR